MLDKNPSNKSGGIVTGFREFKKTQPALVGRHMKAFEFNVGYFRLSVSRRLQNIVVENVIVIEV